MKDAFKIRLPYRAKGYGKTVPLQPCKGVDFAQCPTKAVRRALQDFRVGRVAMHVNCIAQIVQMDHQARGRASIARVAGQDSIDLIDQSRPLNNA
ncbi:hypothetical protein GALL_464020 [mine drainage metagenome]|uniref:Uncharacterized protein n=1 Tax=mine drainage metagenome TaxID=410659 RepID=A0A1J5PMF8_9ZZZZ